MAHRTMTEQEAIDYINERVDTLNFEKNEVFAVRGDNYVPARKFRNSWQSPDGTRSYRLPGVCAVLAAQNACGGDNTVESLPDVTQYGNHTYLLIGERVDLDGTENDAEEIIIKNHKIVAIIQ